ncbi:hypothetical protein [Nostoc edaphicum]|nr:hypothetical protein [Nostoc edaphicum]
MGCAYAIRQQAEALLEIPGISGSYEVPTQREGTLAAIAPRQ